MIVEEYFNTNPTQDILTKLDRSNFEFYLGGSRYMHKLNPDLINICHNTDYDFYCSYSNEVCYYLESLGFVYSYCGQIDNPYLDINAVCIYEYLGVQVVCRKDVELYNRMWKTIDPQFFYDFLWKSSPKCTNRNNIGKIINQLLFTSMSFNDKNNLL